MFPKVGIYLCAYCDKTFYILNVKYIIVKELIGLHFGGLIGEWRTQEPFTSGQQTKVWYYWPGAFTETDLSRLSSTYNRPGNN